LKYKISFILKQVKKKVRKTDNLSDKLDEIIQLQKEQRQEEKERFQTLISTWQRQSDDRNEILKQLVSSLNKQ